MDLGLTLGPLRRGTGDPAHRATSDGAVWRASRTPAGPGTLRLAVRAADGTVEGRAWGPGADWLLDRMPALLGADDDPSGFDPSAHPFLRAAHRRHPDLRLGRTGLVMESLIPAVLEQKVTTTEAYRGWRLLLHRYGEPAPGPAPADPVGRPMRVPPKARDWAAIPSWEWHRAGVDSKRAGTVLRAVRLAPGWRRPPSSATRRPAPGSPPCPASACGPSPRPFSAATATPTRSRSATSTSPTRSAGTSRAANAPTTPGCWPSWPPGRVTASAPAA